MSEKPTKRTEKVNYSFVTQEARDRGYAVMYNPTFQKEYAKLLKVKSKLKLREGLKRLSKRWGVHVFKGESGPGFYIDDHPVRVIDPTFGPVSLIHPLNLEEERYLTLKLDLHETTKTLLREIEHTIKIYRLYSKARPKERVKRTTNHWEVYRMRQEGKTYEEIVMALDPTEGKDTLWARKDLARKSYKKCVRIIESVAPIGK